MSRVSLIVPAFWGPPLAILLNLLLLLPAFGHATPSAQTIFGPFSMDVRLSAGRITTAQTLLAEIHITAPIEAKLVNIEPLIPSSYGARVEALETIPPRALSPTELRHEASFRIVPFLADNYPLGARATFNFENTRVVLESEPILVSVQSIIQGDLETAPVAGLLAYPKTRDNSSAGLSRRFGFLLTGVAALASVASLAFAATALRMRHVRIKKGQT